MAAKNVRNQKEAGGNRKKSAQEYTGVDKLEQNKIVKLHIQMKIQKINLDLVLP